MEGKHTPEWIVSVTRSSLGDTGDYMTSVELTNGEIALHADSDDTELELQEIADTLNNAHALLEQVEKLKAENDKLNSIVSGIYLMEDMIGRRGCTYSDTEYDSLATAFGYNECLEQIKDWITRIKQTT